MQMRLEEGWVCERIEMVDWKVSGEGQVSSAEVFAKFWELNYTMGGCY